MKKINKEFVLSDSSLNCYSFRLLTSGYQLSEFQKNPIGYYMHQRDGGVVVRWEDLQVRGDQIIGKPVINTNNARGIQTADEVETGFLNAASMGHVIVLESSDDPALKLPGQQGVTITKWYNRECSLVDIPGNYNSLVLYNEEGDVINLSSLKSKPMENNSTTKPTIQKVKSVNEQLKEAYDDNVIDTRTWPLLRRDYADQPNELSMLLANLAKQRIDYLKSQTWDFLDKQGLLEELKRKDPVAFEVKKKAAFNKN